MRQLILSLSLITALALLVVGCQNGPQPVGPQSDEFPAQQPFFSFEFPEGATFESATLYVNVETASGEPVNVHRITADWVEADVTWTNFGGSFAPEIFGTFTGNAGWQSVDVTDLVMGWLVGDYDNFGLLLEQPDLSFPRTRYSSREVVDFEPYLEICFMVDDVLECETIVTHADAFIWEVEPDGAYGLLDRLWTGRPTASELEKQTLIRFELPEIEELAAIGDFVWHDLNCDGYQDDGEPGVPGVTVELYTCADEYVATDVTDGNGEYYFGDLPAGEYYVKFFLPDGFTFTLQNQPGDDTDDSDADPDSGIAACTELEPGEYDPTWDAGLCEIPEQEGCTGTLGYWQGRTGLGDGNQPDEVTPLLPIWLGDMGGAESVQVTDASMAYDLLMRLYCDHRKNGIGKLYAQLLAAKLNFASGASSDDVDATVTAADAFLADNGCDAWDGLSDEDQDMVDGWKTMLDDYNNGDIGPGHCDDMVED